MLCYKFFGKKKYFLIFIAKSEIRHVENSQFSLFVFIFDVAEKTYS